MRLMHIRRVFKYCVFAIFIASIYSIARGLFHDGSNKAPHLARHNEPDVAGFDQVLDSFGMEDIAHQRDVGNVMPRFVVNDVRNAYLAEELEIKPDVLDEHMSLLHETHERNLDKQMLQEELGLDEHLSDDQLLFPNDPKAKNTHRASKKDIKKENSGHSVDGGDQLLNHNDPKAKNNHRVNKKDIKKEDSGHSVDKKASSGGALHNITNVKGHKEDMRLQKHHPDLQRPPPDAALTNGIGETTTKPIELIVIDPDKFNITKDLPERVFDPAHPLGEMGKPVTFEGEMEKHAKAVFHKNAFNLLASDMIAFNRSLPDVRPEQCESVVYPDVLPNTSVIIIFHNEAFTALLRTVHSVINRSPSHLLREIILVDDASTQDHLKSKLDDYVSRHFQSTVPVRIERLAKRSGLIQARIHGALTAKGEVLTYLDSHCEVTIGWLEPLLATIAKDRRNVVTPTIDIIDDNDLSYKGNSKLPQVGSFSWTMGFRWTNIQSLDMEAAKLAPTLPIRSPTMAGGLFAIDKSYFIEIGMYDPGFEIWGAENLELSFKTWMCGGSLYVMACSHVGHIFRKYAPYAGFGSHFLRNTKRLVEVWLDDAKAFYYKMNPDVKRVGAGDIQDQIDLRKRLECKSFAWYLDNVFPESSWPRDGSIFGFIRNPDFNMCLEATLDKKVIPKKCGPVKNKRLWEYTPLGEVRQDQDCLDYTGEGSNVIVFKCHKGKGNQLWSWNNSTKQILHGYHNACLGLQLTGKGAPRVEMTSCLESNPNQRWEMPPRYSSKIGL